MSLTSWFLLSGSGTRHRLPREMIFVGRDDCELMLQSRSVDKQHAVINYEAATDEHKVKDLGSLNGTFVNDVRIQEQVYTTLKMDDKLRFGYDTNLFTVVRGELHVPEEALKHEKFTSQLQLTKKVPEVGETLRCTDAKGAEGGVETVTKLTEASRVDDKMPADVAILHRGTPLYGQPSWWGDGDADDENSGKQDSRPQAAKSIKHESDNKLQVSKENASQPPGQEPSYFEIPSKVPLPSGTDTAETHFNNPEGSGAASITIAAPASETASHGHASFTIDFDTLAPAKGSSRDRPSKGQQEHRARPKRGAGEELSALQVAMVAAEVKVADWLAQNELPLARSECVAEDDGDSVKSDVPVQLKSLRGSKHDDGTQSDSENALGDQVRGHRALLRERVGILRAEGPYAPRNQSKLGPPAKKMAPVGGEAGDSQCHDTSDSAKLIPTNQVQEGSGSREGHQRGHIDDQSDRGTYTIELENGSQDEEEARRMIDKVFGVEDNQALTKLRYPEHQRDTANICPRPGAVESRRAGHMFSEVLTEDVVVVGGPRWVSQWATLAASHVRTDPEGSGGDPHTVSDEKDVSEVSRSSDQTDRKKRNLPLLPEKTLSEGQGSRAGRLAPTAEKQDTETREKDGHMRGPHRAGYKAVGGSTASIDHTAGRSLKPAPVIEAGCMFGRQGGSPSKSKGAGDKIAEVGRKKKKEEVSEKTGKPLLRQESFTVERPSVNVPLELIPCIDAPNTQTKEAGNTDCIDATTLLRDSEAVAAFLETTLSDLADPPSYSLEGSVSPESDIDTTSTISLVGGDGGHKVVQKRRPITGQSRDRGGVGTEGNKTGARDSLKSKSSKPSGPAASRSRPWTSLDLTDDDLNSSLLSETRTSKEADHAGRLHGRSQNLSSKQEAASNKLSKGKSLTPMVSSSASSASKPSTLPRPRPTRASLLRRARLGETPDPDLADVDRASVASEASTASSASRPSGGRRTLSRIEVLAQPRRPRGGSPSARSDSEATSNRTRGVSSRPGLENNLRMGLRSTTASSGVAVPRARANSASKLPDKTAIMSYTHQSPAASGRWRRVPVEYASTSEDEFGSNRHPTKHARPIPLAPRVTQLGGSAPPTPNPAGMGVFRHQSREQDDYMRDWTAHSEEIARISQDLAKDLAMLAREIHDVAGEIDSVSPSSAADHSGLEDGVFRDSLGSAPEISTRNKELRPCTQNGQDVRSIRRRTWNRDEAVMDSLLLASVSQLSSKIRQGVDKTVGKIRILFKDKDRNWEEIESKMHEDNEIPLLKTSNQEISSILQDLKRVEKQLLVIDIMVDPDGTLDALSSRGVTSPLHSEQRVSSVIQGAGAARGTEEGTANATLGPGPSVVPERDLGLDVNSNAAPLQQQSSNPHK
ncbi:centrosomal protein of 170 kDa isoform X2 [Denticeps clupeoides]|uniref:centrosomal protein of 170 kDa isoform X2 n=1 Tax=Denticeps clupeoides TaxID=299321 RepID=UPI0010A2C484|nr:centrosomal protein of 170 kDa-like isoform X2 [Denticeps clupeoides]